MATRAPSLVSGLATDWATKCGLKSAKLSGIVGDSRHRSGYHKSRQDLPATDYSVVRPDDLGGPDDMAAAIDMTMSPEDMRVCTARLVAAYSNANDPRRKYINAFNGTTDSRLARRWDVYARKVKAATSDHLAHAHLEIRRKYVGSATAMAAILSILKGESVSDYLIKVTGSVSAVSAQSTSTAAVPKFPGVLKRNDSQSKPNASVRLAQLQLRKHGIPVTADGFFGPKMQAAVKTWQRRVKLSPDGIIGPKTWPSLWRAK